MAALKLKSISFSLIAVIALAACNPTNGRKDNADKDLEYGRRGIAEVSESKTSLNAMGITGSYRDEAKLDAMTKTELQAADAQASKLIDGAGKVVGALSNGDIVPAPESLMTKSEMMSYYSRQAEAGRELQKKIRARLARVS